MCVFPSTVNKGFSWLNRTMDVLQDIQASDVVLRKLFCVKNLWLHIIDNHSRDLLASNCARVSIKPGRAARKLLKRSKQTVKPQSIATFLLNNLRSRPAASQGGQSLRGLPHIGELTALAATLSWALLVDTLWNFLVDSTCVNSNVVKLFLYYFRVIR